MRDFTIRKYKQLLGTILDENYKCISVEDILADSNFHNEPRILINRHDIDTKFDLSIAYQMADFEFHNNVRSSYYFRTVPETLDLKVIKQIADFGHEIGYHYEVMALTRGDEEKAIERFKKDLEILRTVYPVKTICQHGGAMGYYNTTSIEGLLKIGWDYLKREIRKIEYFPSSMLWDKYKFEDFNLIGDAYLSLNFKSIKYFSDTGQRWDSFKTRILDNMEEGENAKIIACSTDELIGIIKSGKVNQINILVHPANWHDNYYDWIKWKTLQKVRNTLKKTYKPTVHK